MKTYERGEQRIRLTTMYGHDPEPFVEGWILKYWSMDSDLFCLVVIDDEEYDPETEYTYQREAGNEHDEEGWLEIENSDEDPGGRPMGSTQMPRVMIVEIDQDHRGYRSE